MLSKLLKHEFRATGRIMLPVYLIMLLTAGMFNLFMRLANHYDAVALEIFRGLSAFLFGVTVFGSGVVTLCLMVYRFYKNYMTDEGYLMFTLPVTTAQLIWSKLIVAVAWTFITFLAMCLAVFVGTVGLGFWKELLPELSDAFSFILPEIPSGHLTAYIIEIVATALFSSLSSYLMFFAAISLGHSFANHKILYSVGFYIAFTIALQTVSSFAGIYGIVAAAQAEYNNKALDPWVVSHVVSLGSLFFVVVAGVIFYLLTHTALKKRLNLQ